MSGNGELARGQWREVLLQGPLVGLLKHTNPKIAWHQRVRRRIHEAHDGTFWVSYQAAKLKVELTERGTVRTCGFHDLSRVDPLVRARVEHCRATLRPGPRRRICQ